MSCVVVLPSKSILEPAEAFKISLLQFSFTFISEPSLMIMEKWLHLSVYHKQF